MALRKLVRRNYGGKFLVSIKYQNLYSFKEGVILLSDYPWNEKNNTFAWLISLYNPFNKPNALNFCFLSILFSPKRKRSHSPVPNCKRNTGNIFHFWTNFTIHFTLLGPTFIWRPPSSFLEFGKISPTHPCY